MQFALCQTLRINLKISWSCKENLKWFVHMILNYFSIYVLNVGIFFLNFLILKSKIQFILLFSRQGKLRLQKWYNAYPEKAKKKIVRDLIATILGRKQKMSSFLEWKESKIVYKRLKFVSNTKS